MAPPRQVRFGVPLAASTTLGVGGPAWGYAEAPTAEDARALLDWASARGREVLVLGGGSNVLIADAGFDGLVLRLTDRALAFEDGGGRVRAAAGASWDGLVQACVARDLAGVECLSGIPGDVGAAPIQNIGAYGQELAEHLVGVTALRRADGAVVELDRSECGFGYRDSRFKRDRGAHIVLGITLELRPNGAPTLRYPEIGRRFGETAPTLAEVRAAVLDVRRGKSMVLDPADPNSRSAGSFFTNPIVPATVADDVAARAEAAGFGAPPRYPAEAGVKLSAAWLIQHAGFDKGFGDGPARLSDRHCLALVNRGGARAADLVALACTVRVGVRETFGVTLVPEPVFVGFDASVDDLLG